MFTLQKGKESHTNEKPSNGEVEVNRTQQTGQADKPQKLVGKIDFFLCPRTELGPVKPNG